MQNRFRKTHTIGNVELWKHPEGHKFIRFKDSPMQGHEIPHPSQIPQKDSRGVNFVTNFKTQVNGKRERIWAKEAGSRYDQIMLKDVFKEAKVPLSRHAHHARILKQLQAAGFESPEALGILHPKQGTPLMLTTHIEGKDAIRGNSRLEQDLERAGFKPQDLHDQNVFETKKGHVIIDASLFGPTDKTKLNEAIAEETKRKSLAQKNPEGFLSRLFHLLRKN